MSPTKRPIGSKERVELKSLLHKSILRTKEKRGRAETSDESGHNLKAQIAFAGPTEAEAYVKSETKSSVRTDTTKKIWIPGYPGSGSELLRKLIMAITGEDTSGIYFHPKAHLSTCLKGNVVTCKTHWPMIESQNSTDLFTSRFHPSAVILL